MHRLWPLAMLLCVLALQSDALELAAPLGQSPRRGLFADIPSSPVVGDIYIITDALDASTCTQGGGTSVAQCVWDGTDWVASGGGGTGGATTDIQQSWTNSSDGRITGASPDKGFGLVDGLNSSRECAWRWNPSTGFEQVCPSGPRLTQLDANSPWRVMSSTGTVLMGLTNAGVFSGFSGLTSVLSVRVPVYFGQSGTFACTADGTGAGRNFWSLSGSQSTAEGAQSTAVNFAGSVRSLRVKLSANVPASETVTTTFRLNGSDTALACSIAAGASTCTDTSDAITVVATDTVAVLTVCSGGTTSFTSPQMSVVLDKILEN